MSRDQKPPKMRVIAGGGQAPQAPHQAEDQVPEIAPGTLVAEPARGRTPWLLSAFYLCCCLAGGVGIALLVRSFAQ